MGAVRTAEPRDIPRIAEILIFSKRVHYRGIFDNDAVSFGEMSVFGAADEVREGMSRGRIYCVYDDGFVKGMCSVEGDELNELYVEPFFEGTGIGTSLLAFAVRRFGIKRLWVLEKNERAVGFYRSHGFAPTGEREREPGTAQFVVRMSRGG